MTGKSNLKKKCIIHGHFYQPPRENPWLDAIEAQPSAAPHHDWNERIYDECYRPNAFSRILDPQGRIFDIHNNYSKLSFNIGPTLFRWLEEKHPLTAQRIIEADKKSVKTQGHGNAIAQVYNHVIMPLANKRDQLTQIRWAKSFFKRRFNRDPEGFWLAETAIDMETVNSLIEENVKFVVLSPTQAEAISELNNPEALWESVADGSINTKKAYRIYARDDRGTKTGGYIDVFFFDEGLSRAVSFEKLLTSSENLGKRINGAFSKNSKENEAVIIATDGETFGHHSAYGDMCLAHFFTSKAHELDIEVVNFGNFLEHHPPKDEVKIKNAFNGGSAWSCAHGTGRWIRDCGCMTGGYNHWNQKWRGPLRESFNYIQSVLDDEFEEYFSTICTDPWNLRDKYEIVINGDNNTAREFIINETSLKLEDKEDVNKAIKLLECQKYMMFSFTSCGWFFADIGGIEPVQNMLFAARAIQLGLTGQKRDEILHTFLSILNTAKGNIKKETGKTLFQKHAFPLMDHREILCFTASVENLLFNKEQTEFKYFDFILELINEDDKKYIVNLKNRSTGENNQYSVVLTGDNENITGEVIKSLPEDPDAKLKTLSLSNLFTEMQQSFTDRLIKKISRKSLKELSQWYTSCESTLEQLTSLNNKLPNSLHGPISFLLTSRWNEAINKINSLSHEVLLRNLTDIYREAHHYGVEIDLYHTAELIEVIIKEEILFFMDDYENYSLNNIKFLLDMVDNFKIPLSKNVLEDRFYSAFDIVIQKCEESGTWDIPRSVIQFAERMNFAIRRN